MNCAVAIRDRAPVRCSSRSSWAGIFSASFAPRAKHLPMLTRVGTRWIAPHNAPLPQSVCPLCRRKKGEVQDDDEATPQKDAVARATKVILNMHAGCISHKVQSCIWRFDQWVKMRQQIFQRHRQWRYAEKYTQYKDREKLERQHIRNKLLSVGVRKLQLYAARRRNFTKERCYC